MTEFGEWRDRREKTLAVPSAESGGFRAWREKKYGTDGGKVRSAETEVPAETDVLPAQRREDGDSGMSTHSSGSFGRTSRRDRAEKLQIEAEELYSRARAHSDSAAQLRREREGYEALRPSYRQLTPEQMGEYMAENVWGRNQAAGAEMAKSRELSRQAQTARSEAELEEELAFRIAYGDIPYREDYAEKSLPIPGGTKRGRPVLISSGARTGAYIDSGYDDIYYDIINGDADARNLEQSNDMTLYGALQNHQYLYRLTDEERGIYNYLYQTDKAQAEKYLDGLTPYLYKRQAERETEDARASAEEDGLGASISSIVTKLDEGLSYLPQLGDVLAGNELDANAPYNRTVRRNSAIRETVANQWGPVGSFLYQTGMSMADFLFSMAASGGSAALNLAILGTGAAAETVWSLKNAGLDDTRAFILGTAAGAAEIFTEQTSLETLLDPELLADGLKKYILKNMLAEGSEELASDLLNWAADDLYDWIAGEDKSEWKQKLRYCEALGIDPQTAAAQLIRERLTTAGLDALGGSLSGLVLSGAKSGYNAIQLDRMGKEAFDTGSYREYVSYGLNADPDTEVYQYAKDILAKLNTGREVSNIEMGKLTAAFFAEAFGVGERRSAEELNKQDDLMWDGVFVENAAFQEALEEGSGFGTKGDESEKLLTANLLESTIGLRVSYGALDPISRAAEKHAEQYYESVRKMSTDAQKIAGNTGFSVADIERIKSYVFIEEHNLGEERPMRFSPSYEMAESWQRLIEGKNIQPHDITLINHELMESKLVKDGMSQYEAHIITSSIYNYNEEVREYYDKIKKRKRRE